jgi:hypothetical protein
MVKNLTRGAKTCRHHTGQDHFDAYGTLPPRVRAALAGFIVNQCPVRIKELIAERGEDATLSFMAKKVAEIVAAAPYNIAA